MMRVYPFAIALLILSYPACAQPSKESIAQPANGAWIISETTSPIDYSPQITAAIFSQSTAIDAPTTFTIRCRQQRTELLVSTSGSWRAMRGDRFVVDYAINDQAAVKMRWLASEDGRAAIYDDDVVRFLRSLPDGGRIKISVFDVQGSAHEATFPLTGLEHVRKKFGEDCKWPPAADRPAPVGQN